MSDWPRPFSREDISADERAEMSRLRFEVQRLRQRLSQLNGDVRPIEVTADFVRRLLDARQDRKRFFGEGLFADPAWDLLLRLFLAHLEQVRVSKSALCFWTSVPQSTGQRWITKLKQDNLIVEKPDRLDARRVWIELSSQGLLSMQHYFEALGMSVGDEQPLLGRPSQA